MDRGYDLSDEATEQATEQPQDAALALQMEVQMNEARKGAEWNRKQAERHVAMAVEGERVVEACAAALNVLNPQTPFHKDIASAVGTMARY